MLRRAWIVSAALLAVTVSACLGGDGGNEGEALTASPPEGAQPEREDDGLEAGDGFGASDRGASGLASRSSGQRSFALLAGEIEPNDTIATANGPYANDALIDGAISPVNDQDYFSFTIGVTSDVIIETSDGLGPGSCVTGVDTIIRLIGPDGTTVLASDDDSGISLCSRIEPKSHIGARQLPPGTYYVHVHDYLDNGVIASYKASILVFACGDGEVEATETCDDGNTTPGDGCDAACQVEPVCGDGVLAASEECDDGNTTAGDHCSPACLWEVRESEPNDVAAAASGPIAPGTTVAGSIGVIGDVDYLSFVVPRASNVRIETFDRHGAGSCDALVDTVVTLFAPDGTTVLASDDEDGILHCSLIDPAVDTGARMIAAGTYYVRVADYLNNSVIPGYTVQITLPSTCGNGVAEGLEECDDGNAVNGDCCSSACQIEADCEAEPNGSVATASGPYPPGLAVRAAIDSTGDQDYFSFTVTAVSDVVIETFDSAGPSYCSTGLDTVIGLIAADGTTVLADDDDDGPLSCSRISPAVDPGARRLSPGTYYVHVNDFKDDEPIAAYTLRVSFSAVCGDGVLSGYEECDDGGLADGDGCDHVCTIQPIPEAEPNDSAATANGPYATNAPIVAAIDAASDDDWFAVTVPGPASTLTVEVAAGSTATCGPTGTIDSEIAIYGAGGASLLAFNDDANRSTWCSRATAYALPAGTYTIRTSASAAYCSGCQYDYNVLVHVE